LYAGIGDIDGCMNYTVVEQTKLNGFEIIIIQDGDSIIKKKKSGSSLGTR